jgi:membrane-associated protein
MDVLAHLGLALSDSSSFFSADTAAGAYFVTFLLVALDGVIPIFPGETTLTVAASLAATGDLELWPVFVAGFLGAVVGDTTVYFIGRHTGGRIDRAVRRMVNEKQMAAGQKIFARNVSIALVFGRFVPGLRLLVSLLAGANGLPFWRYLPFECLGGLVWSAQISLLAYFIGSTLDTRPMVSFLISGLLTAAVVAVVVRRERRLQARLQAEAQEPA